MKQLSIYGSECVKPRKTLCHRHCIFNREDNVCKKRTITEIDDSSSCMHFIEYVDAEKKKRRCGQ